MTLNYRQKAWAYAAGILAVFGTCAYFIFMDVGNAGLLIPAAFGCFPWAKYIWLVVRHEQSNTVRQLKKAFPKLGFSVTDTTWDDDKTAVRFTGEYRGDNFIIEAAHDSAYVRVVDLPWLEMKAVDPAVPRMQESINETNAEVSNMCVYMTHPDDDGIRHIYTLARTILPSHRPEEYLDVLMCDMLNRKRSLQENFAKERPWLNQRRGPVGFTVNSDQKSENNS